MTRTWSFVRPTILFLALYVTSVRNYLLFHCLAEVFSIVIAGGIFIVAWNARRFIEDNYLMMLGVACLFVGGLDLVHTLAYRGMGVFPGSDTNLATQLWIAARFLECSSLALIPVLVQRRVRLILLLVGYSSVATGLLLSIFTWKIFPACFIEGSGLTAFKRMSEYSICATLLMTLGLLFRQRERFDPHVLRWLAGSMVLTVGSELSFTFYADPYGFFNLCGHFTKILAFWCVYKAIIETGLTQPYALLFRDLKQSEERYHSLFTHMINGAARHQIVVDDTGEARDYEFLEVNAAFERMTGLKPSNLIGKRVSEIIPNIKNDPADWIRVYGRVALKGESARFENYSVDLQRWYSVIAYSPEPGSFVTIFEDITSRKAADAALQKAQAQLMRVNAALEQKVQERTAKLQETVTELEEFSYSIVHDMRAPLRTMNSFAALLLEECRTSLSEEHRDYLERIGSAGRRLDTLIRDVLSYSKVARGAFELGPVDLDELINQIVRDYPCFHSDQAQVVIHPPLGSVLGNTALLTQCLANLLSNATKFVVTGTKPQIEIWTEQPETDWIRMVVADRGIGIKPEHMSTIWRIFERAHHQHEFSGTGIGLSIVKKGAERMGGRVGVESEVGKGSRFWIELKTSQSKPESVELPERSCH